MMDATKGTMPKRNVTLQSAAQLLGVSADAMREWCRNHGAPSDATRAPNGRVLYYLVNVTEMRAWRGKRQHGNAKKNRVESTADTVGGGA
jgi:hypothetical protein